MVSSVQMEFPQFPAGCDLGAQSCLKESAETRHSSASVSSGLLLNPYVLIKEPDKLSPLIYRTPTRKPQAVLGVSV